MFIGHYGVSFAVKRFAPRMSLGILFLAVQLLDEHALSRARLLAVREVRRRNALRLEEVQRAAVAAVHDAPCRSGDAREGPILGGQVGGKGLEDLGAGGGRREDGSARDRGCGSGQRELPGKGRSGRHAGAV